ncbi:leucine--tRNA ligase, partial [bacterium]|nr:leucine--tRNA ligase [bacterium]
DTPVEQRALDQWFLKTTAFAEELLADLEELKGGWPDRVLAMQRHWIGRSEGATIRFPGVDAAGEPSGAVVEAFTTRPDTLGGATYAVLAPEHPLVDAFTAESHRGEVQAYRDLAARKSDLERTGTAAQKTGVDTGGRVQNPLTGEAIPVWIADYVLGHYGTGAIMCVPAHDQRDFEFAKAYGLPVRPVVEAPGGHDYEALAWEGDGVSDTPAVKGLPTAEAIPAMIGWLEAKGHGEATVTYRLRDWLFSRQRYWGEPIPVIHTKAGEVAGLADADLPLTLPEVEHIEPASDGSSPLSLATDWVETPAGKRETHTMPQWAGSCWYYLRYLDPHNDGELVSPEKERLWMPVNLYVGGAEHAVLHLLYARFWHKVLFDLGVVHTKEPFLRLQNVGHVQGADGQKMSKNRGNVVNPDDVVEQVGADVFRLFEMFMGPFGGSAPWSPDDIQGVRRFLDRAWRLLLGPVAPLDQNERLRHATIIKVTADIASFDFNTAISALMIYLNSLEPRGMAAADRDALLGLLTPFAPHFAEEVHLRLGGEGLAATRPWPEGDPEKAAAESLEIPVMVAGKLRARLHVPAGTPVEELERLALALEPVQKRLSGPPRRVVVVPDRLVNIVP